MFALMLVGLLCRRARFLDEGTVRHLADLAMYVVTPCVIVQSFARPFERPLLRGFLVTIAAAAGIMGVSLALAYLFFRKTTGERERRRRVLRFGVVFSNCGYMAIPLVQALLGEEGVFYAAAYQAVFNTVVWTVGVWMVTGGRGEDGARVKLRTIFLHPAILSVAVGMVLFLFSVDLPSVLARPVGYLAALNTPIPMLIIGYYLADLRPRDLFSHADEWGMVALRLLAVPLLALAALRALGVRGSVLVTLVLCAASPVATISTMFQAKFAGDPVLSSRTVSLSTLLSLLTLTAIVSLAMRLA